MLIHIDYVILYKGTVFLVILMIILAIKNVTSDLNIKEEPDLHLESSEDNHDSMAFTKHSPDDSLSDIEQSGSSKGKSSKKKEIPKGVYLLFVYQELELNSIF